MLTPVCVCVCAAHVNTCMRERAFSTCIDQRRMSANLLDRSYYLDIESVVYFFLNLELTISVQLSIPVSATSNRAHKPCPTFT